MKRSIASVKIVTILLSACLLGSVCFPGCNFALAQHGAEKMSIKIIFDSEAKNAQIETGWGFSCLINDHFLFDTGGNGKKLLNNLGFMNIKLSDIKAVIISHVHNDHISGLWYILKSQPGLSVYICPKFSPRFKEKIKAHKGIPIESQPFQEIGKNIFITGGMPGIYAGIEITEQSIILKTAKGLIIITGCAHPGIIAIVKKVKNHFTKDAIYLVLGGFHLKNASKIELESIAKAFRDLGVKKVSPLHCSGSAAKKIFKKYYKDNLVELLAGETLEI